MHCVPTRIGDVVELERVLQTYSIICQESASKTKILNYEMLGHLEDVDTLLLPSTLI